MIHFRGDCYFDHAISEQIFIVHKYYIDFDIDPADIDYFLDISFDRVSTGKNYCCYLVAVYPGFGYHYNFDQVQEHRAQWDPGLKEGGGMLGPLPNQPTYTGVELWIPKNHMISTPISSRKWVRRRRKDTCAR
ncbi:hypothetical protein D1007_58480 [Hordeum vulgare]|nr:hypothetical protein D1007_58480 [Hordeum vulgare]